MITRGNAPPEGISIEYLKEVSERSGINFKYETSDLPFTEFLAGMKTGQGPDLTTTLVRTPEREAFLSFTDAYIETPVVIFARAEAGFITGINDLSDKSVAISRRGHVQTQVSEGYPEIKLALFDSTKLALTALATGQVVAYIGDLTAASHIIHKFGYADIHVAAPTHFDGYRLSMANRKDWPELTGIINKVLRGMSSEQHSEIRNAFHPLENRSGLRTAEVAKWAALSAAIVFVIVGTFFFWNRSLTKRVGQRTAELESEIAERERAMEAVRKSEARYQNFIANSSETIFCVEFGEPIPLDLPEMEQVERILDHGYYVEVNEVFAQAYGMTIEEACGATLETTFPRSLPTTIPTLLGLVRADYNLRDEETVEVAKDGSKMFFLNNVVGRIRDGKVDQVWGTARDITQARKAEEDAAQARRSLVRAERVLTMGELSGSIAHELNQPLTGILSNAQSLDMLMKSGAGDEEQMEEIVGHIVSDTKRAGTVIRNLQNIFRHKEARFSPLNLNEVINEALSILKSELVIQHASLATELETPGPVVQGDKVGLQQVLINLVMNASQAMQQMPDAQRSIRLGTESSAAGMTRIWVEDTGPGIDASLLKTIFDPFSTSKEGGMGMGLVICRTIIESHGGKLWAEDGFEGGARFQFTIPVIEASN